MTEFYYDRGVGYLTQQEWSKALADFERVIALNSNDAETYTRRGFVRFKIGDKPVAISDLQQAQKLFSAQGNSAGYEKIFRMLKQW